MNILVEPLPETLEIEKKVFPINTDFRSCLRTILAFEDPELSLYEKQIIMLENLYVEIPENIEEAIIKAMQFLNGGNADETSENIHPRVYSFSKDDAIIFAAFRQTHNINLQEENLHWWEFLALFADLGSETTFCNLVALRKRLKTGKASKEDREMARELGDLVKVPELDTRTLKQKENAAKFWEHVEAKKRKQNA